MLLLGIKLINCSDLYFLQSSERIQREFIIIFEFSRLTIIDNQSETPLIVFRKFWLGKCRLHYKNDMSFPDVNSLGLETKSVRATLSSN